MICSTYSTSPSWSNISGKEAPETWAHLWRISVLCAIISVFLWKREWVHLLRNAHTYAPVGGLLIANQKLCFHSDCLSPLWKVSPVVTKTTIQQWQMNVAHSWVMRWAGDLSINKLSIKLGVGGGLERRQWEGWKDGKTCNHRLCLYTYTTSIWLDIAIFTCI